MFYSANQSLIVCSREEAIYIRYMFTLYHNFTDGDVKSCINDTFLILFKFHFN